MGGSGRWDVVLRVVARPGAGARPYRGPLVTVGIAPGPGGLRVPAGVGVAARHCTLTACDARSALVAPVEGHPVRVGPYAEVDWDALEPIPGPVRLERGGAFHLGATGQRGVTVEFLGCRDLGVVDADRLASSTATAPREPACPPSRRSGVAHLAALPGVLVVGALLVALGAAILPPRPPVPPPRHDPSLPLAVHPPPWGEAGVQAGFEAALHDFVIEENRRRAAGLHLPELSRHHAERWDGAFFAHVVATARAWASERPSIFRRLEHVRGPYARVVARLRAADLPEVFAGVPMLESCYDATATSPVCARGWWQLMPEFGARYRAMEGFGPAYDVRDCGWVGSAREPFTPTHKAPPGFVAQRAPYHDPTYGRCQLRRCAVDFREDLERSTDVALHALREALDDPDLAASGAAVQIALASHHAGYDDARWLEGRTLGKAWNLRRAYLRWREERADPVPTAHFHGDVMRCGAPERTDPGDACARYMSPWTQVYAPRAIAGFLLAVCYYGRNHADDPAFRPWRTYLGEGGYCAELPVPAVDELAHPRFQGRGWCGGTP